MNEKASLASNATKLTISKGISLIVSMISAMLLTRFRSYDEYGTYSQLLLIVEVSTTIIMMGLPNCLNYFLARADSIEERNEFANIYYTANTVLGIITGIVVTLLTPLWVKYFDNPLIASFAYFLALFPWVKIISSSVENLLVVYRKTNLLMAYRILNSVSLLGIILFVQFLGYNFDMYMLLYICVEVLFTVWIYVIEIKETKTFKPVFKWNIFKKMLIFSVPIGVASMIGTMNTQLDKLMMGWFLSTEKYAIYSIASKELPLAIVASSITAVILPYLSKLLKKNENQKAVDLWGVSTKLSYRIMCFFSFALVVFSPEVITFLYSSKYIEGVAVFSIYSLVLLFRCTYWGMILNARGKTKFILYSSIGSLVLNIVLNYLFFKMFGFIGPALATLLAQVAINVFQLIATSKEIKISFKNIMPWKDFMCITAINVMFALLFYVLKISLPLEQLCGEVVEAIVLGIVWGVVIILTQLKPMKKEWDALQNA